MIRPRTAVIIVVVCYLIAGTIDYAAARVSAMIRLDNSAVPASMGEAARARPDLGRPSGCISHQHRIDEPWLRRTCWWTE